MRSPRPRALPLALSLSFAVLAGTLGALTPVAAQELPLTGPAYQIADQAYRSYALGDYPNAILGAREAIRLRPDVVRLKTLLRQAEQAQRQRQHPRAVTAAAAGKGRAAPAASDADAVWLKKLDNLQQQQQYEVALAVAEQGLRTPGRHDALAARNKELRTLAAQQAATSALEAEQRGDLGAALAAIRSAPAYAPEAPQYRLMLIKLLLANKDEAGAMSAAKLALAINSDDAMTQSYYAYLLQRAGDRKQASTLQRQAMQSDALGDADLRNLRLIGADAALAASDAPAALDALQPLKDSDPAVRERRGLARAGANRQAGYQPTLTAPVLRCVVNRFGPVCSLFPAGLPSEALASAAYKAAGEQRLPEALALLDEALRLGGDSPTLRAQKDAVLGAIARQQAAGAFQALADNHPAAAQQAARKAIGNAPDVMAYRMLLIDALVRDKKLAEAETEANTAIKVDSGDVTPLAMRGYLRQRQNDYPSARRDYVAALAASKPDEADGRNLSLFIADAALAGGDTNLANDTLARLPATDAEANWRRTLTPADLGGDHPELLPPLLDYRGTPYDTVCTLKPSPDAPTRLVEAVFRALAQHNGSRAVTLAHQLTALAPDNESYKRVLVQALDGAGDSAGAAQVRASLRDPVPELEFAYLAQKVKAPTLALQTFQQIDSAGKLPDRALQDAGYAAINANDRASASGYLKRAVDASRTGDLVLEPQQVYDTRRAIAELDRTWGGYASLDYRGSNPQSGPPVAGASGDNLQLGAEVYWRPERFNQDGRYVDLYARVNGTAYSSEDGINSGAGSLLGAVGVRVKPLASQNVILAFERLVPLGADAQGDWLARAAYSYGIGTDLRVDTPSWNMAQVYAEAGRYLHAGTDYFTSEAQFGRSYITPLSWPKNTVLTPFVVVGAEYNQGFVRPQAIGAGFGLGFRYWFREDLYAAPRSYFDLGLQYRFRLSGDDRAGGLILRATITY